MNWHKIKSEKYIWEMIAKIKNSSTERKWKEKQLTDLYNKIKIKARKEVYL